VSKIKIGIVGVGNCASSLIQGIHYYREKTLDDAIGLMHWQIGGYSPSDIEVVAAFDIDARKVGQDLAEAIFSRPNCTTVFCPDIPRAGVAVHMGPVLDGFSHHMRDYAHNRTFVRADVQEPDNDEVVHILRKSGTEVLMNYLPVGSEAATQFYAACALQAGIGFINNIPVFIASDPASFAQRMASIATPAELGESSTERRSSRSMGTLPKSLPSMRMKQTLLSFCHGT